MASKETKVAESLVELTESHWFNPASMARYLSEQPIYTIEQVMELVKWIIHYQDKRYQEEVEHGRTSEALILANELNNYIKDLEPLV